MPAPWKLAALILAGFAAMCAADAGDDFSNNLFSDLAPLLALFGERVTMQFMSQSTGWADNFILAMAPLGIITIITSAIRVGGPSWLKAIIGRARENLAVAEAELMSSTSHEVCELWNGQGIVRCIGSPSTTEFICLRPADAKEAEDCAQQVPDIIELKEALEKRYLCEVVPDSWADFWDNIRRRIGLKKAAQPLINSEVEEGTPSRASAAIPVSRITIVRSQHAAAPNISLNSHNHFKRGELRAVAVLGTLLQLGVLAYSGLATYHPRLTFPKGDNAVAGYAFPCTAGGTIVLIAGLLLCAHVVESSTEEKMYQPAKETAARLIWLQQTESVGEQWFQSFALSTGDNQAFITTSRRADKQSHAIKKTVAGTAVSSCGFVVQFIGLRGMHWSASIAQLGAVLAMAAVRAWVRRGLVRSIDWIRLAPGYELEWFVTTLGDFDRAARPRDNSSMGNKEHTEREQAAQPGTDLKRAKGSSLTAHDLMVIRKTLGGLTAWQGPISSVAVTLARAIRTTLDSLSSCLPQDDFIWSLQALSSGRQGDKPPEIRWARDVNVETIQKDIEVALSLRLHLVHSQLQPTGHPNSTHAQDSTLNARKPAGKQPADRNLHIIGPGTRALRRDLGWWMPPDVGRVLEIKEAENGTIKVKRHRIVGRVKEKAGDSDRRGCGAGSTSQQGIDTARYNGEAANFNLEDIRNGEIEEDTLLASESYGSIELLYAQDMFTAFMQSAARQMTAALEGGSDVRLKDSGIHAWKRFTLHNDKLSRMAQDICNSGLGNLQQSYLSIIQPLGAENKLPEPDNIITKVQEHATPQEQLQHFVAVSDMYLWLFETASTFPRTSSVAIKAVALLFEILRRASLTFSMWESQGYKPAEISEFDQRRLKIKELILKHVDQTTLLSFKELYRKQRRLWQCDILQDIGTTPTRDEHVEFPETFNFMPLHDEGRRPGFLDLCIRSRMTHEVVNQKDIHDWTPLHYATTCHRYWLILCLQPYMNARDLGGWTPLHYACAAPDIQDPMGNAALHWAALKGHVSVVEYLYEDGAKQLRNKQGRTALHLAAMAGKEDVVRLLAPSPYEQNNVNIDTVAKAARRRLVDVEAGDFDGMTPLHMAAAKGHEGVVQYLVGEAGVNTEARDSRGSTPLHEAAYSGHEAIVQYLIGEAGVNTEARDINRSTLLHAAAYSGHEAILRYLVADSGHEAIVRYLLGEAGVDKEARDYRRDTPLHRAAGSGHKAVVRYLVGEAGVNIEARDSLGCTPLHIAACYRHEAVVRYLVGEAGVDKEAKENDGRTPLHLAASSVSEDIVRYLVTEAGVNKEARDDAGKTPAQYAAESGLDEIVRILEEVEN
ncbi:ankyrin repeat protein [Metarhizium album ARSEF 1941]|uniref:Ankyrin repeat protein n=1 Tax=Metarhizium album (strain ARSEF 1941) TaxID=1081103 RepID=A0A0B2WP65_METAS|nr:ankyrin repeat protein [Metarhizium album ARSEF 1941]KHN95247.1 ankyrin repeat protein [Metarhizium album ARSEF 1941]